MKLNLPLLVTGAGDNLVVHNESLEMLDAAVMPIVSQRGLTAPPGTVADGEMFIVDGTGSGSWLNKNNNLAYWNGIDWIFIAPVEGMQVFVADENIVVTCQGDLTWTAVSGIPTFSGQKNTTQSVSTTSGTWTNLEWNNQLTDNADSKVFEHSTSSNPERIIVREAGTYEIHANISLEATGTAVWVQLQAQVLVGTIGSPSAVTGSNSWAMIRPTDFPKTTMTVIFSVHVLADQEIRLQVARQTTSAATTINVSADTRVIVKKID
jgi:hypothetical protein